MRRFAEEGAMDSLLRDYFTQTFAAFKQFPTDDPALKAEVDALKADYMAFGERCGSL